MKEIKLNIDGKEVKAKEGSTIVEAAKQAGIRIPTLCYHENLSSYGACRICSVEITGNGKARVVPACTHHVEEGLTVNTSSERVLKIRRRLIDLLLTRAPEAQIVQDLATEYGIKKSTSKEAGTQQKCVSCDLCCLCVRVCDEIVGMKAIGKPDGEK
ncbi:MAG: 2Fe-2S iron-sulfur cluster-binding protein, partial [Dehalococcoidia bacterium]